MSVPASLSRIELVAVAKDGKPAKALGPLPGVVMEVTTGLASMYRTVGFHPPWTGYLAVQDQTVCGTCAFKGPPADGQVEIAYFTFPGQEGRGVAQTMARLLVDLAMHADSDIRILAQTLPTRNASTAVLQKIGFSFSGPAVSSEDGEVWQWHYRGGCV